MENYFINYSADSGISKQDFKDALQGLIEKGLVEEVVIDNEVKYELTPMGRAAANYINLNHSDKN